MNHNRTGTLFCEENKFEVFFGKPKKYRAPRDRCTGSIVSKEKMCQFCYGNKCNM